MATQVRPPRTRGGGGRTLMLLGVLLALGAGIIVIYVVSTAVGPTTHTVTVVVAQQNLQASTILTSSTGDSSHTAISAAFATKQVNADFAPQDAYAFVSLDKLSADLNDKVVVGQFYAGDILRKDDPRLVPLGQASLGSLTNINPAQLPKGSVLVPLIVSTSGAVVAGDHVDILATVSGSNGGDLTQTTLQDVYVYTVTKEAVFVVLTHQQALELKYLVEHSRINLVLRKPGDENSISTTIVDNQYIMSHYFHP